MSHLRQFHFHIRSILKNAAQIQINTIRQSFMNYQQSFDCISSRFPFFNDDKKCLMVTKLLLYDNIQAFENYAEQLLCRADLPYLVELAIDNDILLTIIDQNQQRTRDNCSHVEVLRTLQSSFDVSKEIQNFFPLYCKDY
ncbi:hypothetical protein I4U23_004876 [Adineta vaga]|nr:hypothetical protein I4U23_004876 [Adineta vaga]